ncbi:MAG: glucose PTS transporter subunit IIA [Mycoplasma sp.]|nr:glucose PTS transporter subunit IIA [Mycoplasma sp.]
MTLGKTIHSIFSNKYRPKKDAVDNSNKKGGKEFLSKISGAFMLPISVMAIGGLFLGVGAAITANFSGAADTFGQFIQNLGQPIFDALALLFLIAIVISFTDNIGTAVFSGVVAYLVFNSIQTPFISVTPDQDKNGNILNTGTAKILFGLSDGLERKVFKLVGNNLGIQSLQTSVFGGILVGFISAWSYNKFNEVELPMVISFFGGKRFVAFVNIILMIPVAFLLLLLWPWIGIGLAYFGEYSAKVSGLDSFVFGYLERALVPFGLHHVFYAPLWWTAAGGDPSQALQDWVNAGHTLTQEAGDPINGLITQLNGVYGDQSTWIAADAFGSNDITWRDSAGNHSLPVFKFFQEELGMRLGRFLQGKYAFMQTALPAAGAAMIMAAPKKHRKAAMGSVIPSALTSFLVGVTEPIEFTFLFLAPALFWGFHAIMAGVAFSLMNILGAHMGMTFSGGFIDTIIYGILPVQKGTEFWWAYVIGIPFGVIYYIVFYWSIKHFNLATPGRGGNVKLFTKKDYKKSKESNSDEEFEQQTIDLITAFGGKDNITHTANCATRLRYDVKDASKVNEQGLKDAGAFGVVRVSDTHIQAIVGTSANVISRKIQKALNSNKPLVATIVNDESKKEEKVVNKINATVKSVAVGKAKELKSLDDGIFSKGMLGDGLVIEIPKNIDKAEVYAPISGKLVATYPTKHAYGILNKDGYEVLVHIGIDTVKLDGSSFEPLVKKDDEIKAGDVLAKVDFKTLRENAPSADVIVVITSGQKVSNKATGNVKKDSELFKIN